LAGFCATKRCALKTEKFLYSVFYANYLKFMERARTERLRHAGINLDHLHLQHRRLFVVRSVVVNYHIPARYNDQLTVSANIMTFKPASIEMEQPIKRGNELLISTSEQ